LTEPLPKPALQPDSSTPPGKATITAHRFRHTIGSQLAEGRARIQTIMTVLGHRTLNHE
jgi:integrase